MVDISRVLFNTILTRCWTLLDPPIDSMRLLAYIFNLHFMCETISSSSFPVYFSFFKQLHCCHNHNHSNAWCVAHFMSLFIDSNHVLNEISITLLSGNLTEVCLWHFQVTMFHRANTMRIFLRNSWTYYWNWSVQVSYVQGVVGSWHIEPLKLCVIKKFCHTAYF